MSFDWYKHNPADYLHDVAIMTLEQKGAYSVIINQIMLYDRPLADDDRHLARLIGCHVLKWRAIKQHLVAMDKLAINGKLLDVPLITSVRTARHARRTHLGLAGHRGGVMSAAARKTNGLDQAHARSRLEENRSREDK